MTHKKTTEIILIDNLNILWGDDLKRELKNKLKHKTQLKIIGNEFSLHAFETLHKELNTPYTLLPLLDAYKKRWSHSTTKVLLTTTRPSTSCTNIMPK